MQVDDSPCRYPLVRVAFFMLSVFLLSCQKDEDVNRDIKMFAKELRQPAIIKPSTLGVDDLKIEPASQNQLTYDVNTIKPNVIYLFSAGRKTGNLGGIDRANIICQDTLGSSNNKIRTVAFLQSRDTPMLPQIPVVLGLSPQLAVKSLINGAEIATTWSQMFSDLSQQRGPKLRRSLIKAGIFGESLIDFDMYSGLFWSGHTFDDSNKDPQKISCNQWKSEGSWGKVGGGHSGIKPGKENSAFKERFPWYDYNMTQSCDSQHFLLCIAFRVAE